MTPIMWTCHGCEFNVCTWKIHGGYKYPIQSCGEPSALKLLEGSLKTPDWCPLLPLRRVVGQCLDCKHAEDDGDIANCSCTHPEAIVEVPALSGPAGGFPRHTATFACCYWETKKP
jgi:hypothetical protein